MPGFGAAIRSVIVNAIDSLAEQLNLQVVTRRDPRPTRSTARKGADRHLNSSNGKISSSAHTCRSDQVAVYGLIPGIGEDPMLALEGVELGVDAELPGRRGEDGSGDRPYGPIAALLAPLPQGFAAG